MYPADYIVTVNNLVTMGDNHYEFCRDGFCFEQSCKVNEMEENFLEPFEKAFPSQEKLAELAVAAPTVHKLYLNRIAEEIAAAKDKKNKEKWNAIKALIADSVVCMTAVPAYFHTVITWEHDKHAATAKNILAIQQSTLKLHNMFNACNRIVQFTMQCVVTDLVTVSNNYIEVDKVDPVWKLYKQYGLGTEKDGETSAKDKKGFICKCIRNGLALLTFNLAFCFRYELIPVFLFTAAQRPSKLYMHTNILLDSCRTDVQGLLTTMFEKETLDWAKRIAQEYTGSQRATVATLKQQFMEGGINNALLTAIHNAVVGITGGQIKGFNSTISAEKFIAQEQQKAEFTMAGSVEVNEPQEQQQTNKGGMATPSTSKESDTNAAAKDKAAKDKAAKDKAAKDKAAKDKAAKEKAAKEKAAREKAKKAAATKKAADEKKAEEQGIEQINDFTASDSGKGKRKERDDCDPEDSDDEQASKKSRKQ